MQSERRAVIDIGTNSVKVLVAEVSGSAIRPVVEQSRQTRLGQGFYKHHRLQSGPIAQTARAVAEFVALAREHQAQAFKIIATSAVRDAVNAQELASAVQGSAGLPVEVISGEQEAIWAFQGVTTDPRLAALPLVLLDVGGGSTQFSVGSGGRQHFHQSFPLGTVRLIEHMPHSDPPTMDELAAARHTLRLFLTDKVAASLGPALDREAAAAQEPFQLVATGGTATILARIEGKLDTFDRERIEAAHLSAKRVRSMTEQLWGLPLQERKLTTGLPANRADVILAGVAIYEAAMETFGFPNLRISTRGLRFGAVASPLSPLANP